MTSDQVQIVLVAAACAVGVGAVGLVAAWLVRHLSIRWQLGLIVVVSVGVQTPLMRGLSWFSLS